jgi:hypothetical protein
LTTCHALRTNRSSGTRVALRAYAALQTGRSLCALDALWADCTLRTLRALGTGVPFLACRPPCATFTLRTGWSALTLWADVTLRSDKRCDAQPHTGLVVVPHEPPREIPRGVCRNRAQIPCDDDTIGSFG